MYITKYFPPDAHPNVVKYIKAIEHIYQGKAGFSVNAPYGYDNIEWESKTLVKPTEAELETAIEEIAAEEAAVQYMVDRKAEYPDIADQLDVLFHQGYDGWKSVIQAVKDKYPKP